MGMIRRNFGGETSQAGRIATHENKNNTTRRTSGVTGKLGFAIVFLFGLQTCKTHIRLVARPLRRVFACRTD